MPSYNGWMPLRRYFLVLACVASVSSCDGCSEGEVRTVFEEAQIQYARSAGDFLVGESKFGPFEPQQVISAELIREFFTHQERVVRVQQEYWVYRPSSSNVVIKLRVDSLGRLVSAVCNSPRCKATSGVGVGTDYAQLKKRFPKIACTFEDPDAVAMCKPSPNSHIAFAISVSPERKRRDRTLRTGNVGSILWTAPPSSAPRVAPSPRNPALEALGAYDEPERITLAGGATLTLPAWTTARETPKKLPTGVNRVHTFSLVNMRDRLAVSELATLGKRCATLLESEWQAHSAGAKSYEVTDDFRSGGRRALFMRWRRDVKGPPGAPSGMLPIYRLTFCEGQNHIRLEYHSAHEPTPGFIRRTLTKIAESYQPVKPSQ
jgi:hypothetical protein